MIKQYKVITAATALQLTEAVVFAIQSGWQPVGGVHAGEYGGGKEWAQAVVK